MRGHRRGSSLISLSPTLGAMSDEGSPRGLISHVGSQGGTLGHVLASVRRRQPGGEVRRCPQGHGAVRVAMYGSTVPTSPAKVVSRAVKLPISHWLLVWCVVMMLSIVPSTPESVYV